MKRLHNFATRPSPAWLAASALLATGVFLAAPAQAQVPTARTPVMKWQEDFNSTATRTQLNQYTGVFGEHYTADADWLPAGGTNSRCNGWVLNSTSAIPTAAQDPQCTGNGSGGAYIGFNAAGGNASTTTGTVPNPWGYLQRMAYVIGAAKGTNPDTNYVVASLTNGGVNQPATKQLSIPDISIYPGAFTPEAGRFYIASALFAAVHCSVDAPLAGVSQGNWYDPIENVNLVINGTRMGVIRLNAAGTGNICPKSASGNTQATRQYVLPDVPTATLPSYYPYPDYRSATLTNAQAAGNIFVAKLRSDAYKLTNPGDKLGVEINNSRVQFAGNDVAFDLIQLLEATPTLYKSFNALDPENHRDGAIAAGKTGTLTFIIVNTDDLVEKTGWSFTDQLPVGVTIANPPNVQTTCQTGLPPSPAPQVPRTVVTVVAGGNTIKVENGSIAEGDVLNPSSGMCKISVDVTAANEGVYVNDVNKAPVNNDGGIKDTDISGLVPDPRGPAVLYVNNVVLTKSAVVRDGPLPAGQLKPNVTKAGDVITYTFTLENHGTTNDDWLELEPPHLNWNDPQVPPGIASTGFTGLGLPLQGTIGNCKTSAGEAVPDPMDPNKRIFLRPGDPGETISCTATYTVVQADIDKIVADPAGTGEMIKNTAVATADAVTPTPPNEVIGPIESAPGTANVPVKPDTRLTVKKEADKTVLPGAGKTVTYTITIKNEGATTLHEVKLTDTFNGSGTLPTPSCSPAIPAAGATLAPGAQIVCNATYTVTAADAAAGTPLVNTATVNGKKPGPGPGDTGGDPITPVQDTVELSPLNIGILKKDATVVSSTGAQKVPANTVTAVGDVITYTFTLTNNGTGDSVIETGTLVWSDPHAATAGADGFTGSSALTPGNCKVDGVAPPPAKLVAGKSIVCTASYTVTQADIDNAVNSFPLNNAILQNKNAKVTMNVYPDSDPSAVASRTATDSHDVPVKGNPHLSITKKPNKSTLPAAGETVTYTITITNDGNETLNAVTLTDNFYGNGTISAPSCSKSLPAKMVPGDTITCTAQYTVVAADVAQGSVTNMAEAANNDPLRTATQTTSNRETVTLGKAGVAAIPTLDPRGLALLALMLGALVFWTRRGRRS